MKNIRNWQVKFIDGSSVNITAEDSKKAMEAWNSGAKGIMVGGGMRATHQIIAIEKDNELGEDDAQEHYGVSLSEALRNQKQLETKYKKLLQSKSM